MREYGTTIVYQMRADRLTLDGLMVGIECHGLLHYY